MNLFDKFGDDTQWAVAHGTHGLEATDIPKLKAGALRVYNLMEDGEWHDANEIRMAAGQNGTPASEGLRRLRDLRPRLDAIGKFVNVRRKSGRLYEYRIEDKDESQS